MAGSEHSLIGDLPAPYLAPSILRLDSTAVHLNANANVFQENAKAIIANPCCYHAKRI